VVELDLSATDPDVGDTLTFSLVSGPGNASVTDTGHFSWHATDVLNVQSFDVVVGVNDGHGGSDTEGFTITVQPNYLNVLPGEAGFQQTATGFKVRFDRAFDASKLNLYGSALVGEGPADVTPVGPGTSRVAGSLVLDADQQGFTFIKTGGALAPGSYTATLASRSNGFVDLLGRLLDGDNNGINGDNYSTGFTVDPMAASRPTLSIGDFARGPGQPVNLPATGSGLPITLTNGAGVSSLSFELHYDVRLLQVSDVTLASGLSGSPVLSQDLSVPGVVKIALSGLTGLTNASTGLVRLQASVPTSAGQLYKAKEILDLQQIRVNGAPGAVDDAGLHVVGYIGEVTGDGSYSTLDIQRISRVAAKADTGFSAYPLVDPVIVGDVSGDGTVSAYDGSLLLGPIAGKTQPLVPAIPAGVTIAPISGPDPTLSMPTQLSAAWGEVVRIPILLDNASGLEAARLHIAYDASAFELVDVRKGSLTGNFLWVVRQSDLGVLVIDMAGMSALDGGTGSLVDLGLRVKPGATPGRRLIDLQWADLNEGRLTLTPMPQPGPDGTDGWIGIDAPPDPSSTAQQRERQTAEALARTATPAAAPTPASSAPVIDWSSSAGTNLLPTLNRSSAPGVQTAWMGDFVNNVGKDDTQRNPNSKLRVTLPKPAHAVSSLRREQG
jgi:hypothetical protein